MTHAALVAPDRTSRIAAGTVAAGIPTGPRIPPAPDLPVPPVAPPDPDAPVLPDPDAPPVPGPRGPRTPYPVNDPGIADPTKPGSAPDYVPPVPPGGPGQM